MTTIAPATPCFSLFSEENKFSICAINGGTSPPVSAFVLEPVIATAVIEESSDEESEGEYSDEESEDESENEIILLSQIVTRVDREPMEPADEEEEKTETDEEDNPLAEEEDSDDEEEDSDDEGDDEDEDEGDDEEEDDHSKVEAALKAIAEYEDEKFQELAENLKKTKLLKHAGLIDEARVRVNLGWTSMVLYIR